MDTDDLLKIMVFKFSDYKGALFVKNGCKTVQSMFLSTIINEYTNLAKYIINFEKGFLWKPIKPPKSATEVSFS